MGELRRYRLICFTDAGFATLHNDRSIEPNIAIFGKVLFRDGTIHCHGFSIAHRCAKIQRVCKSSLSADSHAAVTAGDYAFWYQIMLIELLTHHYQIRKLCPPADCPILNPFPNHPTDEKVKGEKLFLIHQEFDPAVVWKNEMPRGNQSYCESCRVGIALLAEECVEFFEETEGDRDLIKNPELSKPPLLADCCSLFSSI